MKAITEFIKSVLFGGLFVLLPVSLLFVLLAEMLDLAVAVATPITLLFPEGRFDETKFPVLLAIGLILLTSLGLGLLMRSPWGVGIGRAAESRILLPIPGYAFLKHLTLSLGGRDQERGFQAALKRLPNGGFQAVYIVEQSETGMCTILLPHAPAAMSGPVEIIPHAELEVLDVGFGDFMQSISHWGTGLSNFTVPSSTSTPDSKRL